MTTQIVASRTTSFLVSSSNTYLLREGSVIVSQDNGFRTPSLGANEVHMIVGGSVIADDNAFLISDTSVNGRVSATILDTGLVNARSNTGFALTAGIHTVINRGTVSSTGSVTISLSGGDTSLIENHGQLTYHGNEDSFGQVIFAEGNVVDLRVVNTGEISTSYTSAAIEDATSTGAFSLRNTGLISAVTTAVKVDTAPADVWNGGVIDGNVQLGASGDVLDNSGTILGDVALGNGPDRAEMVAEGAVQGTLSGGDGNDTLLGGDAADQLDGDAGDDLIKGGGGDDSLDGATGRDTLRGQGGDDQIETGGWTDIAYGGAGDDVMTSAAGNDTLLGGTGDDTITGGSGDNTLKGGTGDDILSGNDGFDQISGGAGDDDIKGDGFGDTLAGGRGDDTLAGGSGNDRLKGGQGNDHLTGDSGADRFVFAPGWDVDRITDFVDGVDRLDLSAFNFANFADLTSSYSVEARSGAVLIDFGDGDMLFVEGVGIASFSGADIIF